METLTFLPAAPIQARGPVSEKFLIYGIDSFRDAARALHTLPYGRTSNRGDYTQVLKEGRGTCSTKHGLLTALARECAIPVELKMGMIRLDTTLDSRVAPFLEKMDLEFFPEAHSYCSFQGQRFDITFPDQEPVLKAQVLKEFDLDLSDIGERKKRIHREYLQQWLASIARQGDYERIWKLREDWIAFLGQATT